MQKDLRDRPQFLMITDTAMGRKNGKIYAFGPVVMELAVFRELFGSITWIGFERPDRVDDPVMVEVPEWVNCVLLKKCGGDSWKEKLRVIGGMPAMLAIITHHLPESDVVHTRAPSSPAFLGALLSFFFRKKIWWHKYAGNWAQVDPPFFYALQRWYLSRCHWAKVTINGRWPDQPAHCLSFENPCLTEGDRSKGAEVTVGKSYTAPYRLCFVGRLETAKGVGRILEALQGFPHPDLIEMVHFVGDGPERHRFEQLAQDAKVPVKFHGFLPREKVFDLYKECHFFLLPSTASEGFPKVLAEAANFGCIPLVSDVSSVPHYIHEGQNGFLWKREENFKASFNRLFHFSQDQLKTMALEGYQLGALFTFERYGQRIKKEILHA